MKARILALFRDDFVRHNAIFFIGSIIVAVLNYAFHPIVSRLLTIEQFGEVQALFSLLSQLGIPLGIFSLIALNLYTNDHTPDSPSVRQFSLLALYVALGSVILLVLLTPYLVSSLKLSSAWGLFIIASTLIMSALTIFGRAHLQASHRFVTVSITGAIGAGGKLIASVALVWAGFATLGALGGFFLASLGTYVYVYRHAGAYCARPRLARLRYTPELAGVLRYGILILFGTGLITFFSTADIIIAKYLFTAETAGLYSGISIIARIIFFATASVSAVLLSHVKLSESPAVNRQFLFKGLIITGLVGGTGVVIMTLFPTMVISLMLGSRYVPFAHLLGLLAVHTYILAFVSVFINYALALHRRSVIGIALLGTLSTVGMLLVHHATPEAIVGSFLGGGFITLGACAIAYRT